MKIIGYLNRSFLHSLFVSSKIYFVCHWNNGAGEECRKLYDCYINYNSICELAEVHVHSCC